VYCKSAPRVGGCHLDRSDQPGLRELLGKQGMTIRLSEIFQVRENIQDPVVLHG
jgi:hypothetical protein